MEGAAGSGRKGKGVGGQPAWEDGRPDPRTAALRRGIKRQRQLDAAILDNRVRAIGRNLRRQVSTEAHVKQQRTLRHIQERSALMRMLGRRHALGEFG